MTELTLHTGCAGDETLIHVDWFDHNGVYHRADIRVGVEPEDKPRTLSVKVDGKLVFQQSDRGRVYA